MVAKTAQDLWKPKRLIEKRYQRTLKRAMKILQQNLNGLRNPREILREIKKFSNSHEFKKFAEAEALKMVTHVFADAGRTWRQAAAKNGKGSEIYKALKKELQGPIGGAISAQVEQNATLIRTLPQGVAREVTQHIAEETFKSRRPEDLTEEIKELFSYKAQIRAQTIARTETAKANTALTHARSKQLGLNWYIWRTAEDVRVRSAHALMDDVICSWDNPPNPELLNHEKRNYGNDNPGEIFNCRCFPAPIVNIDFEKFPHKVCYQEKIITMTKKQFLEIM